MVSATSRGVASSSSAAREGEALVRRNAAKSSTPATADAAARPTLDVGVATGAVVGAEGGEMVV